MKMEFDLLHKGYYKIASAQSGKVISVQEGEEDEGDVSLRMTTYTASANQQWAISVAQDGQYKFSPKSSVGYSTDWCMAAGSAVIESITDVRNVQQREYTDNTGYKDEWCLYLLDEYRVNLTVVYDLAYTNRYSNASSRIRAQVLTLQEKYLREFGITVDNVSLSSFSSYADAYCSTNHTNECDHVSNSLCGNSILYTDGTTMLEAYHHTNIYNIILRIPFPDLSATVKVAYIGHDYCTENNHSNNPYYGLAYQSIGLAAIMNFDSNTSETKTLIHEFGHLYGVKDHYGGSAQSTEQIKLSTGNEGYDKNCIYGENKETSAVLSEFAICDGCKSIIETNINRYNH